MRIACLTLIMLISSFLARAEDAATAQDMTPTAQAGESVPQAPVVSESTGTPQNLSPTAEPQSLSPTATPQALSPTAGALLPPDNGGEEGSSDVSLPVVEVTPEPTPAPRLVMRPRIPLSEMALAGLGGGIIGGWLGFFSSDQTASGGIDYSSVQRNVMIYGGTGVALGATLGYLLGSKSEIVQAGTVQGFLPRPALPPASVVLTFKY